METDYCLFHRVNKISIICIFWDIHLPYDILLTLFEERVRDSCIKFIFLFVMHMNN